MKFYNANIIETLDFLNSMSNKCFPQKIGYAIIKNVEIFSKEYAIYQKMLQTIIDKYMSQAVVVDGVPQIEESGLPLIEDEKVKKELIDEINSLLALEVDINPYLVDEEIFNYDDENKYDILSTRDLMILMNLLTEKK